MTKEMLADLFVKFSKKLSADVEVFIREYGGEAYPVARAVFNTEDGTRLAVVVGIEEIDSEE